MSEHPTLGRILKELRNHRGWTLKEMSDHTGIPVSTLSKVEHDRLTLTYDKLLQLSQKLNIVLYQLLRPGHVRDAESESADESVTARRSIGRIDDSVRVTTPNYDYYYLCTELRRKRMVPILTRIRAKSLSQFGDLVRHSGEEYIHVLEGSIIVHTEFYDPVTLHTGEGIYIDSNMGHAYVADKGCDEALVLGVCSSADESLMSSLMNIHEPISVDQPAEELRVTPVRVRRLDRPAA